MTRSATFLGRIAISCALFALIATTATAQFNLGFRGAGLSLGFVDPDQADAAWTIGAFADMGQLSSSIMLEPYFDFWSKSETVIGGGEVSVRDATLGAKGKYMFSESSRGIQPFAGLGLGLHFVHARVTTPDFGFIIPETSFEDSQMKLGLDLGGGIRWPYRSVDFRAELWFSAVSDWNQLGARVGIMWPFGGQSTAEKPADS